MRIQHAVLIGVLAAAAAHPARAQLANLPPTDTARLVRISDHLVGVQQNNTNVYALATKRGIVLFDTQESPARAGEARALIEKAFRRHDYAYVIDTHEHTDHIGGNSAFPARILVGHERMPVVIDSIQRNVLPQAMAGAEKQLADARAARDTLAQGSPARERLSGTLARAEEIMAAIKAGLVPPAILVHDTLTLDLGDRKVRLVAMAPDHSASDLVAYIPEEHALVMGGIIQRPGTLPIISTVARAADVERTIERLAQLTDPARQVQYALRGHGSDQGLTEVTFKRDYYRALWQGLKQARQEGLTLEQARARFALDAGLKELRDLPAATDASRKLNDRNIDTLWALLPPPARPVN